MHLFTVPQYRAASSNDLDLCHLPPFVPPHCFLPLETHFLQTASPRTGSRVYSQAVCFGDTIHFYVKASHNHLCFFTSLRHLGKKLGEAFLPFLNCKRHCVSFASESHMIYGEYGNWGHLSKEGWEFMGGGRGKWRIFITASDKRNACAGVRTCKFINFTLPFVFKPFRHFLDGKNSSKGDLGTHAMSHSFSQGTLLIENCDEEA